MFVRTCSVAQEEGKVNFPQTSWRQQNQARRAEAFEKKNQEKFYVFVLRKLMKLKKLARYARLEKLKANSLAVELGAGSTPRPKGIGF